MRINGLFLAIGAATMLPGCWVGRHGMVYGDPGALCCLAGCLGYEAGRAAAVSEPPPPVEYQYDRDYHEHVHGPGCGCPSRYIDGHLAYWYHGHWEYYDGRNWYIYQGP